MHSYEVDIAIIGGGCIGSSIFYALTQRNLKDIMLVDKGRTTLSATAHSGGMIRVFHENIEHIDLALNHFKLLRAYQALNIITEKSETCGSLYFFNKSRYINYKTNLKYLKQKQYPFDLLTSTNGKRYFPQFCWKDVWAIYEPLGDQYSAKRFVNDLLNASLQNGGKVIDECELQRIIYHQNQYQLISSNSHIKTRVLILAGGARMLPQLNALGLQLDLSIKNIEIYFAEQKGSHLNWPLYFDRESLQFGNFKKNNLFFSDINCKRIKDKKWGAIIKKTFAHDIYTPNRLGLLGKVPGFANLYIATGWGGTAFKFSLEIANRFANLLENKILRGC